jgi:bifunctional DNA-binding transcriptional regulator/antitoxin component of YhaV-PrlF toxin-antitoxin module
MAIYLDGPDKTGCPLSEICMPLAALECKAKLPYTGLFGGVVMSTLTVTSKGQVTLRKDVLDHLGVQPGQRISVDKLPDGRVVVSAVHASEPISVVFDLLKRDNRPALSIDEINDLAAKGWADKR